MVEGIFDIVFAGRIIPSKSIEEVKAGLAKLFKTNEAQIERLFSSEEVTIKKGLNYAQAMKYQSALKQVGALVLIKKQELEPQAAKPLTSTETAEGKSKSADTSKVQASPQARVTEEKSPGAGSATAPQKSSSTAVKENQVEDGEWGVAAAGERLPEQEKQPPIPEPDLSGLSLGNTGEKLSEIKPKPKADIDTSSLTLGELAPLPKSEKAPPKEVDTSSLSVAAAGEKIPVEKQKKEPVNPRIDHLEISK